MLIFTVDGITDFPETIRAEYPRAEIQRCLVHQVRNSLAQMSWKDRKEVATCLRSIYTAPTEDVGLMALAQFEEAWGKNTHTWSCPGGEIGTTRLRCSNIMMHCGG